MKGLWIHIPPFAPDQSGAAAVLCELGGLMVIIDAGGCAGNICGFDEPRWFFGKSAIFSAGLRDMDAILGRDERLVEKTKKACEEIDSSFVALIGTPVPAVIGTDYKALQRMLEKKTGRPVITIDSTGTGLYDRGASKALTGLFEHFAKVSEEGTVRKIYLGGTPLDFDADDREGWLGMGAGTEVLENLHPETEVMVVAPAGLAAARHLEKKYGLKYRCTCPLSEMKGCEVWKADRELFAGKKVLIVHQQILANTLREDIDDISDVTVASWFMMDPALKREGDISLKEEDQWINLVREGGYDVIIADPIYKNAVPFYEGIYRSLTHYAVSGAALAYSKGEV